MRKIINYILISISLISCQSKERNFERSILMINNQQFEILTAYEIFDNFTEKQTNYLKNVFNQIENEFEYNAEYLFLLENIKHNIEPNNDRDE